MLILEGPMFFFMTLSLVVMATHADNDDALTIVIRALAQSDQELLVQKQQDKQIYLTEKDDDLLENRNSKDMLDSFGGLQRAGSEQAERGTVLTRATQILTRIYGIDVKSLRENPTIMGHWMASIAPYCTPKQIKCAPSAYRTIDGSCNNLKHPTWGMTDRAQKRLVPAAYSDGVSTPRMYSVTGAPLPSPRTVSNAIHRTPMVNVFEETKSMLLMQWGQLVDHDVINTPMLKGFRGSDVTCCGLPKHIVRTSCFPIHIPFKDPHFKKTCMNFVRSAATTADDCGPCLREQMNQASSYLDGGCVYGTDLESMKTLRAFSYGMLKMTDKRFFFPNKDQTGCMHGNLQCMKSGDHRIHVFPGLSSTQILMLREHNRIAGILSKINPHWNDERLYQETKKIFSAILQNIHYSEFLEKVIGPSMMSVFRLNVKANGYNNVYNPDVDATISNAFGVAAFRFGHSLIAGHVNMYYRNASQDSFKIEDHYNKPDLLFADGAKGSDHVSRWLIYSPAAKGDRFFEPGVQDLLFLDEEGDSFDLVSLNIQRGRDHGIPGYNVYRRMCNLPVAKSFINMPDIDPYAVKAFAQIYKHPDDIDLFSGGMAEAHVPGGEVGPTFACIIGLQFRDTKIGDRFYFENNFQGTGFTPAQLASIKTVKFSSLMCANNREAYVHLDAFSLPSKSNPYVPCYHVPQLNLWYWREMPTMTKDVKAVRPPYSYMAKYSVF